MRVIMLWKHLSRKSETIHLFEEKKFALSEKVVIKSACLAQLANEKWDTLKKEKEEQKKKKKE